jgi:dihydroxyacetone kinase-like protein
MPLLEQSREELRDLDAAIGDGDLGITVGDGAVAISATLSSSGSSESFAAVLRSCAKAFSEANPSTLSALIAGGLLAAAKSVGTGENVDRAMALQLGEAAMENIQTRGGAALGDKTILDAMAPSLDVLRSSEGSERDVLAGMIDAAREGVFSTINVQSQRGRAAWVGERTVGHADGGATAYVRFLEALHEVWE